MKKKKILSILFICLTMLIFSQEFREECEVFARPMVFEDDSLKVKDEKLQSHIQWLEEKYDREYFINLKPRSMKGIENILLVGIDNPDSRRRGRSDTMIILTLDKNEKELKLTSLMRDTYAFIEGHGKEKLNHSYAYGGINLLRKTVENTFKVKIDHHVIVDFEDFENIVNIIGGVEVNVEGGEIDIINQYVDEEIQQDGKYTLMGKEALVYARIRKIGGCEERTKRQREVISSAKIKLKKLSVFKYPKLLGAVMKSIDTDMNFLDILDYGYWFSKNVGGDMETLQMPSSDFSEGKLLEKKGWVLVMDEVENLRILDRFIFGRK